MEAANIEAPLRERELVGLHAPAREIPNIDAAVAEIARFSAELTFVRVRGRDFEEIWSSLARFSFLAIVPQSYSYSSSSSYSESLRSERNYMTTHEGIWVCSWIASIEP